MGRTVWIASGLLLSLMAAGCGTTEEVEIAGFEFEPAAITVDTGTEVRWTNSDEAAHTASASDGSFDTGTLEQGDEDKVALDEPGSYAYICEFHPFMKGTIVVE